MMRTYIHIRGFHRKIYSNDGRVRLSVLIFTFYYI